MRARTIKPYRSVMVSLLNANRPKTVLDAPCGAGWLKTELTYEAEIDGMDLHDTRPEGYRFFYQADLNEGLPDSLPLYDAVVCCEGVEHLGNPLLLFKTMNNKLKDQGIAVITTPNIRHPEARRQYLLRGFFPDFPCLAGKIGADAHMHIMPWSFPQLFLCLRLAGFRNIQPHESGEKKPRRMWGRVPALPQIHYCRYHQKPAKTDEEKVFWKYAVSSQSLYGRGLVVSGRKPGLQ